MSRVLLLSTYELGARPLGCTIPAALLAAAGHEVRASDLGLEEWPAGDLAWADAVAVSVPMHTALRLGLEALERLRADRPDVPVCLHGLYAHAASSTLLGPADLAVTGESGEALLAWLEELGTGRAGAADQGLADRGLADRGLTDGGAGGGAGAGPRLVHELGPGRPAARPPALRAGLPSLDRYARLAWQGEERLVGTLETTSGCNHRCRHCPVPVIYDGRSRPVELSTLLSEVDALVEEGAVHLHLADPDFLNRPAQALAFARALRERHPACTFDATVKVSHILRHRQLWPELARSGLLFVVSAIESTSEVVLERLDKGHRAAEASAAVAVLRAEGIETRPSLLPFTPWTTRDDLIELLDFVAREDLIWNVEPVQYGIRLLLPRGSLLLADPDPVLAACLGGEDPDLLGTAWTSPDPLLDECQRLVAVQVERDSTEGVDPEEAYRRVRALVHEVFARRDLGPPPALQRGALPGPERPRLTEAWFCCAEPTGAQLARLGAPPGAGAPAPTDPATSSFASVPVRVASPIRRS